MKKTIAMVLVTCLVLLSACSGTENATNMTIDIAKFTEEEMELIDLLGVEQIPYLWDFILDDTVQSVTMSTYEFIDGNWNNNNQPLSLITFQDSQGRLALTFNNIAEGVTTSFQSENRNGSTSHTPTPEFDFEGMASATSMLSNPYDIVYDEEIPLVIQIHTSNDTISSLSPEYGFTDTENYESYEKVYAITITFSQKTVAELDRRKDGE